ncbi:pimeloyl-ACP methyl ester carboxylesterase [Kribbella sp. VKM Ac-2527]|uniref:Pimeloyl-ACP methyl ester carboxylesterase n=1 Tax=Kribbella caucasensis TaxID=2512215 RepID=A0A4R6J5A2_9ACTN|nr:alpha/beta hydrolase [Kribbella sp. VKM Ac-2527]TDO30582.1 pimeloyl-ACP methyl ester carboxylesterase [Kribbella sp. VKM Ac-2527]
MRILLVHGWGANGNAWRQITDLVSEWSETTAPDLRGHGTQIDADGPYTIGALADDLAKMIHDPVVAVGHSMGGQVVADLAARYPELVTAVVVIDPAYGADDEEIALAPDRLADLRERGSEAGAEFVDRAFPQTNELHRETRAAMERTPGDVLADLYESMYLAPGSFGHRPATRDFLATAQHPFHSLYSTGRAADFAMSLTWPAGSTIEVWPGTGHYLHQEHPDRFAQLLGDRLT